MARRWIELGETIRLYTSYVNIDTGEAVDPVTLSCVVILPDSTTQIISYPNENFQKESVGNYFVRVSGDQVGTYKYRITAQVGPLDDDVRVGKFDVEDII